MKKIILILLIFYGCEPAPAQKHQHGNIELKEEHNIVLKSNHALTVTDLGEQYNKNQYNTYWQLIEMNYEGTKYTFLRSNQNGAISMVPLTNFPIEKVKAEIETGL